MVNSSGGCIDADGHVRDNLDKYQQYLKSPYNQRLMSGVGSLDTFDRPMLGTLGGARDLDAKGWLETMDLGGLESTVLYPTQGLGVGFIQEPDFAVEFCRAYNNFLSEEYCKVNDRLMGVALLPLQAPEEAATELGRCVNEMGFVGGMLAADGPFLLGKAEFRPVYAEAERLGTMVGIHGSGSLRGRGADEYLFDSLIQAHTLSHPGAQMRQMTSMIFGGVPESFPNLKIAYLEAGCTWVPYWMDRMDEEYEIRGPTEATHLTKKPSEYILEGRIWVSCEPEERLLPETLRILGDHMMVYASDFPHWDGTFPESLTELQGREDLTAVQKQKILNDNTKALYGLQ